MPWWKCFECMSLRDVEDVRCLDFSHHLLHDVPPDVFQYERTLEELHLNANRIADLPRQLFYCQELKVLNLNDNELIALPPAISSLQNLQRLHLSKNALQGIVENIKGCKHLTVLDVSLNGFIKLPEPVTSVVSLQELYLNDTSLEFLPANFGRLVNLRILELRDNNLSTLPKSLARLQQLQRLDIGSNEFTELPEVIGQLVNLTELWVDSNRIRRISANVGQLTKLVHFEASGNHLTQLPNEVANWTRLQELSVSVNDLKQLPFSIGMLRSLVTLKVDENQLQELPDSISQLEQLEEIMCSHNDLFRLPPSIGLLRRLRFLTADENMLRALPSELCSCVALTLLSVRGNKLTAVPVDIGHLRNLRVVNIVNNFVTHLPVSVLNLQQLSALWISDNQSQPLMPLQKDFGPEQSVRLTCFMLPQTAEGAAGKAAMANGGGGMVLDNDRHHDTMRHLTAKQLAELDEKAAMMSPNGGGGGGRDDDAVSAASAVGPAANKRRICFASDPVSVPNDASARLMRSPTPYPKELRILAKYARYVHTNGQTEYVHVDDLRAAAASAASGAEAAGNGTELHSADGAGVQQQLHQLQHRQQQQHDELDIIDDIDAANHDDASAATNGIALRFAPGASLGAPQLPPNFQPTMSPLLGDDELDARAAYFYATAEQKITTPVPQIIDYENVSQCGSAAGGGGSGMVNNGHSRALLQQQQQQQHAIVYGSAVALPTPAERPASEVRMSQASSFGDGTSLSSAFGVHNGTRSPAMLAQLQQQLQPAMLAAAAGAGAAPPVAGQLYAYADGGAELRNGHHEHGLDAEPVVYYATSQGSDSNAYGQLPGLAWQQQQHQQQQMQMQQQQQHMQMQQLQQHQLILQQQQQLHHLNNSDRVSLASDYARSELSSASGLAMQQQQQQQQQPPIRQPPPYHIARAYTKKSKSDLMHYEQFRTHNGSLNGDAVEPQHQQQQLQYLNGHEHENGHAEADADARQQQQQQQHFYAPQADAIYVSRTPNRTPQRLQTSADAATSTNGIDSNRNPAGGESLSNGRSAAAAVVDLPLGSSASEATDDVASQADSSSLSAATETTVVLPESNTTTTTAASTTTATAAAATTPKSLWLFGAHRNPKVLQLSVPKTLDIGFQLMQPSGATGIFVAAVDQNSIVNTLLRQHDKILDMDGHDFTQIALADALTVLSNAGPVMNVMVSRI